MLAKVTKLSRVGGAKVPKGKFKLWDWFSKKKAKIQKGKALKKSDKKKKGAFNKANLMPKSGFDIGQQTEKQNSNDKMGIREDKERIEAKDSIKDSLIKNAHETNQKTIELSEKTNDLNVKKLNSELNTPVNATIANEMIEARQLIKQEKIFEKSLEEIQDNAIMPFFNYKENNSEANPQTVLPTKQNWKQIEKEFKKPQNELNTHRGKEATSASPGLQEGLEYWQKHLKLGSDTKLEGEKLTPARLAPPH